MQLKTLKKRQDFLRVRGGRRCQNVAFVLEAKPQPNRMGAGTDVDAGLVTQLPGPRFGFTITKKVGNAVTRNRIRRRLKHALSQLADQFAKPGYDYVVVGRQRAATQPYSDLKKDLERCLQRVHDPRGRPRGSPRTRSAQKEG